jgi:hypothetical protein
MIIYKCDSCGYEVESEVRPQDWNSTYEIATWEKRVDFCGNCKKLRDKIVEEEYELFKDRVNKRLHRKNLS